MFKFVAVLFAVIACVAAKPSVLSTPLAFAPGPAPFAGGPLVAAHSSHLIARNYGFAAAPIAAPLAYAAPARYAAPLAYHAAVAPPLAFAPAATLL